MTSRKLKGMPGVVLALCVVLYSLDIQQTQFDVENIVSPAPVAPTENCDSCFCALLGTYDCTRLSSADDWKGRLADKRGCHLRLVSAFPAVFHLPLFFIPSLLRTIRRLSSHRFLPTIPPPLVLFFPCCLPLASLLRLPLHILLPFSLASNFDSISTSSYSSSLRLISLALAPPFRPTPTLLALYLGLGTLYN
ncbi:hypothetical protein DFH08DRAFT_970163 [Mycena albidolilacea]|uniref:Uncharacterized protein n=1 Tax=Mycena albidolilacea TaxID=1033008 RepID=A0AAD6ZGR3_9AGAR|nr:hypothetical protein DFH08DRAFT_970163 [Mycena albidolilacea]